MPSVPKVDNPAHGLVPRRRALHRRHTAGPNPVTTFHLIDPTPPVLAFGDLLTHHGATPAIGGDLIVVAASSVVEARDRLRQLTELECTRCLIVGLAETLCVLDFPSPDNLSGLLEEFTPLGALRFAPESSSAMAFDFIGKRSLADAVGTPYLKASGAAANHEAAPTDIASRGVAGPGGALPQLDRIQRLFGRHDVSGVTAHQGPAAREAAGTLGAQAFAFGNAVAFAGPPDLHTVAHEAAHVVQQRGGVQLRGGTGEVGDGYERHADAVADAVVAGTSAEPLLDALPGDPTTGPAVQRSPAAKPHRAPQPPRVPPRGDYIVELTAEGNYVLVFNAFDVRAWSDPRFTALRYYMQQVFPGVGDPIIHRAIADLQVALRDTEPVPPDDDVAYEVRILATLHRGVIGWMKAHHPTLAPRAPRVGGDGLRHADTGAGAATRKQPGGELPGTSAASALAPGASEAGKHDDQTAMEVADRAHPAAGDRPSRSDQVRHRGAREPGQDPAAARTRGERHSAREAHLRVRSQALRLRQGCLPGRPASRRVGEVNHDRCPTPSAQPRDPASTALRPGRCTRSSTQQ
jgi:Domain of unknown function (DUF4157)